jgi:hypothetical protein
MKVLHRYDIVIDRKERLKNAKNYRNYASGESHP